MSAVQRSRLSIHQEGNHKGCPYNTNTTIVFDILSGSGDDNPADSYII